MMKKIGTLLLPCLLCMAVFLSSASAQQIDSAMLHFGERYETEKAYLHYDKSAYTAGETIWFKAYLLQGFFPAGSSKTFYLDWLDETGAVLYHTVSPIIESSAIGQFTIPETFTGDLIHVRGYTRWMLNFDTAFLYEKDIHILQVKPSTTKTAKKYTLSIFPEGGDAIAGISNKIAFKVTDQWGQPGSIQGVLQNSSGKVLDSVNSRHDGMGTFMLRPEEGMTYTVHWKDAAGSWHDSPLPAIQADGISMQANTSGNKHYFSLTRHAHADERYRQGFVIGTMQQHLLFKATYDLQEALTVNKVLPLDQFPTGILTITVFDKAGVPAAERILFVNNHDYAFSTEAQVQHWGLNKRARNEVEISIPAGMPANLSIAVTDAGIGTDSSQTIFSGLLLTADLKGSVFNPAQYFRDSSEKKQQQLDLVMLTNGWRRFQWQQIINGKYPALAYKKDTAYLALSGVISGIAPGSSEGGNLVMIVKQKDSASQLLLAPISPDGRFADPEFVFFDTLTVYHQFPKSRLYKDAGIRFMDNRLPALFNNRINQYARYNPQFTDTAGSGYNLQLSQDYLASTAFFKAKTLEAVTVRAKTKSTAEIMEEKYTSGMFSGGDGYSFDLVNDKPGGAYPDIFSYLQGKVAGLQITNNGGEVNLAWRGGTPQVYLDEVPTDIGMIQSLPVSDIAFVKVFRPPFMGGALGGAGGAIAIYMRKGNDFQNEPGKGLDRHTIAGYTVIREFYSPNYASVDRRHEQPDNRTTLYWEPMLIMQAMESKKIIRFYNNDVTKAFRVIVEGINKDGQMTHLEQVLE